MITPITFTPKESASAITSICTYLKPKKEIAIPHLVMKDQEEASRLVVPERLILLPNVHRASFCSLIFRFFGAALQPPEARMDRFIYITKKLHPENYQGGSTETSEQGFALDKSVGEAIVKLAINMNCSATGKYKCTFPLFQLWLPHRIRNKNGYEAIDSLTLHASMAFTKCLDSCPKEILEMAAEYLST